MFEFVVIGKGLMGSAAGRYLSQAAETLIIGQDEPADWATHDGVFASHYDQGRIVYQLGKDDVWAHLGIASLAQYDGLQAQSGIRFHNPAGVLYVNGREATKYARHAARLADQFEVQLTRYDSAAAIADHHPMFAFPDGCAAYFETAPGGTINPRDLIRAQLTVAAQQGAAVVSDLVVGLEETADHVTVHTHSGNTYRAKRALVATGAFANTMGILPRPLTLRVKSEVIVLAQVDAAAIDEIYMAPPLRYPDGNTYIKMGCNTQIDRWLTTLEEMQAWMKNGECAAVQPDLEAAVLAMLPALRVERFVMKRCLITYTPHAHPMIGQVGARLFVAVGGNGSSAKCSDAIGRLAADQMQDRWDFPVSAVHFRVV